MMPRLSPLAVVGVALVLALGCKNPRPFSDSHPPRSDSSPPPKAMRIDYVDNDGFDQLFESALVSAHPAIRIQTEFTKPEWGMRLNNWIAAWNAGHEKSGLRFRGQIPVAPVVVNGDSIREFRLLIDDLMNRVQDSARVGGHWWNERSMRERRIALLKPYNLRFHMDEHDHIHLILCHSDYAAQHRSLVRSLADPADEDSLEWSPGYSCSHSRAEAKAIREMNERFEP